MADLLRSRGAEDIDHPGGTLYAHLKRVQQCLARLGAPETVRVMPPSRKLTERLVIGIVLAPRRPVTTSTGWLTA